jgi:hypothetical protein
MFVNQQDINFRGGVENKKKKYNCKKTSQIFGHSRKKQYLCTQISIALARASREVTMCASKKE